MAIWVEPIFDRTQEDVEFAIKKIAEWVAADISGRPIVTYNLKGCLNMADINRIEDNIKYLSEKLSEYGYSSYLVAKKWSMSDMPTAKDITRITSNVNELIASYYKPIGAVEVSASMLNYTEINTLEKNLYLIQRLLDSMVRSFKLSGDFNSGGSMFLPRQREISSATKTANIYNDILVCTSPNALANIVNEVLYATSTDDTAEVIDDVLYIK